MRKLFAVAKTTGETSCIALTGMSMALTRKGDSPWRDWQEVLKIIFVTCVVIEKMKGGSANVRWTSVISRGSW